MTSLQKLTADRQQLSQLLAANTSEHEQKTQRLAELTKLCQAASPELRSLLSEQRKTKTELDDLVVEFELLQQQLDAVNQQISELERQQYLTECQKTVAKVEKAIPAQFDRVKAAQETYLSELRALHALCEPAVKAENALYANNPMSQRLIGFPRYIRMLTGVMADQSGNWLYRYGFHDENFDWNPVEAEAARRIAREDQQRLIDRTYEIERERLQVAQGGNNGVN